MFRNKFLYFMILAEVVLLVVLYNAYQPVVLLWIVILLPVMLKIITVVLGLFVRVQIPEKRIIVTRQSTGTIEIELHNKSFLPSSQVMIKGKINGAKFYSKGSLKPNGKTIISHPVDCENCGVQNVTLEKLYIFDMLKITRHVIKLKQELTVTVVPKIYAIEENGRDESAQFDMESNTFSENVPGHDPSEIFDVRDYCAGDRLSRVHWKLSEKLDRLIVKEYSKPMPDGVEFIIDTKNAKDEADILFSVGIHILEKKGVVWVNGSKTTLVEEFIEEFVGAVSKGKGKEKRTQISGTDYLRELAGQVNPANSCKIVCCMDNVEVDTARLLSHIAADNPILLVCNEVEEKARILISQVIICELTKMDVALIIERIINE